MASSPWTASSPRPGHHPRQSRNGPQGSSLGDVGGMPDGASTLTGSKVHRTLQGKQDGGGWTIADHDQDLTTGLTASSPWKASEARPASARAPGGPEWDRS